MSAIEAPAAAKPLVACRDLVVTYEKGEPATRALDGVDLEIRALAALALLGRSGSGKTTLLHVLGGLVTPSSGSVEWGGQALSSLDSAARGDLRAQRIGYVFQGGNLLPHFSAYENVAFAQHVSGEHSGGRSDAEELLTLVGLAGKLDHLPSELSGGEAQRVAIARALAQSPELLLCDEPTGHLDSDTGERVLDLIEALKNELSFALVVATHDPDVAARFPRQVELDDGRIAREEP